MTDSKGFLFPAVMQWLSEDVVESEEVGGQVKILDFGLAKFRADPPAAMKYAIGDRTQTLMGTALTRPGSIAGTIAYSSPEQARGETVHARTDIFSFGVVLYEMATGRRPFEGDTWIQVRDSLLYASPPQPSELVPGLNRDLDRLILRSIEKDPAKRYQTFEELTNDLEKIVRRMQRRRRYARAGAAAAIVLGIAIVGTWYGIHVSRTRWARNEALPRARLLASSGDIAGALAIARQAERYLGHQSEIDNLRRIYGWPFAVHTTPPGADIYMKPYLADGAPWEFVGTSPLEDFPIEGVGHYRLRATKPGFETVDVSVHFQREWNCKLLPKGSSPSGMVYVPGGAEDSHPAHLVLPDYWVDRYEVTNSQYKQFTDAGAYVNPAYWKHPFVKNGQALSFAQAMEEFKDATGRPGPAGWKFGTFPKGRENFPVNGVSWYEARPTRSSRARAFRRCITGDEQQVPAPAMA